MNQKLKELISPIEEMDLSEGLKGIALDELIEDFEREEEEVRPIEKKQKSGKKDNYNYESLSPQNGAVMIKMMACVSMLRQLKENSCYVYEASLFMMIAYKKLIGLPVNLEQTADAMGINEKQLTRFMENMGSDGLTPDAEALRIKKKGRQAAPPKKMMNFIQKAGVNEDGEACVYHEVELTEEAKAFVVDLCYFSIFESDWPAADNEI